MPTVKAHFISFLSPLSSLLSPLSSLLYISPFLVHVRVISNPSRLFSFTLTIGYRPLLLSVSHGIRAYLRRKIQPSLPIAKLTLPCVAALPCVAVLPCVAALPCAAALPYEVAAVLERRHLVLRRRRHQPVVLGSSRRAISPSPSARRSARLSRLGLP